MALFKINRGKFANLPETKTEGYCYVTLDGKQFFFDFLDEDGELQRSGLNAINAETATALQTPRLINGMTFDGTVDTVSYGKGIKSEFHVDEIEVECEGFTLVEGSEITVFFEEEKINEVGIKLVVNNTEAMPIYYKNRPIDVDIPAGSTYLFKYYNGAYHVVGDISKIYNNATTSEAGLMSPADKSKLDGIDNNANNYTHPVHTAQSNGLYKVTVDNEGHVSEVAAVAKSDITGLGIPGEEDLNTQKVLHDTQSLYGIIEDNILNIDYENTIAFDTNEIVIDTASTTSVLGKAMLGKLVLA